MKAKFMFVLLHSNNSGFYVSKDIEIDFLPARGMTVWMGPDGGAWMSKVTGLEWSESDGLCITLKDQTIGKDCDLREVLDAYIKDGWRNEGTA